MGSLTYFDALVSLGGVSAIEQTLTVLTHLTLLGDSQLAWLMGLLSVIIKVGLGLGFVIFIHELGHFLAAKTFGVRCDKFYIGFDVPISIGPITLPRTLGKFQWGETEYGIGIIPLGGYVKMLGQDDDPRNAEAEAEKTRIGDGPSAQLDPRSYTAKPVWQRMIIISAGVVMNLISAVFLAGAAYYIGVPYTPSVVDGAYAGSPAWIAGLQPGDQVLSLGSDGESDPNLRFSDLRIGVIFHGFRDKGQPLALNIERQGKPSTLSAVPTTRYDPEGNSSLGFKGPRTAVLAADPASGLVFFEDKKLDLKPGDSIVAVDGNPLPKDSRFDEIMASDLRRQLQAKWNQSVVLTIERTPTNETTLEAEATPTTVDVTLPPVPRLTFGIGFEVGPVTAIQEGSIGRQAGFQVGDVIRTIDGQAIVDSLKLPQIFAAKAGSEVVFTVYRSSKESPQTVELKVRSPATSTFDSVSPTGSGELSLGGIGVAFEVTPIVSSVDTALIGGNLVQVGDQLLQYQWRPTEQQKEDAESKYNNVDSVLEQVTIDAYYNIASLDELIQDMPAGTAFECHFRRNGKTVNAELKLHYAADSFRTDERGLATSSLMRIHQTSHLATAMGLGLWETKRRFFEVIDFLRLLFTGRIGFKGVAGPIQLVHIAAHEANSGTSTLLIFLTMLSANLAILNFLPIPALDGGHMMFLAYEGIRRKPVNEELQIKLTLVGVLGLLTLMAFVILKDIFFYIS